MISNTTNHDSSEKEKRLLSSDERIVLNDIADKEPPHSPRAQALLAINEGATQAAAGAQAGLTKGQLRYWLTKFRRDRMGIFPDELLIQEPQLEQPEDEEDAPQELQDVEETAGAAESAPVEQEDTPKVKKKKSKKARKSVKAKKSKKDKKASKRRKPKKKTKKDKSQKTKGKKGKSSK